MANIIGICGRKYNGKDTIADYLVKTYGYMKVSFGDPLKRALKEIFGFNDEQLWGSDKEKRDKFWNVTPREMMQFIGTDCLREKMKKSYINNIGDNIWVMSMQRYIRNNPSKKIVIPDVRFTNEADMICEMGGQIIRVVRDNIESVDEHISEKQGEHIIEDCFVKNDTLNQLYCDVDDIIREFDTHTKRGSAF